MSALCKYRLRLNCISEDDLLYHAIVSQKKLVSNSNKTMTYFSLTEKLFSDLGLSALLDENLRSTDNTSCIVKRAIKDKFASYFGNYIDQLKKRSDTKLNIYCVVKSSFHPEKYLNSRQGDLSPLTKFRLSDHPLPIERGRYSIPKIPRNQRVCTLCQAGVGDELHALLYCNFPELRNVRSECLKTITNICPQFRYLKPNDKAIYLLKAIDPLIIPPTLYWLKTILSSYKQNR